MTTPAVPPRPYRISPLLAMGVPSGYRFDERSGTLQQTLDAPVVPDNPPADSDNVYIYKGERCIINGGEIICPSGVYRNPNSIPQYPGLNL